MDFIELQRRFAAHLRDPQRVAAPEGVEPRRMDVYRELFFNNVRQLLAGSFPVCRDILGDQAFSALVRRFYAEHKAHTPYFLELPREFVEWLAAAGAEPAFLAELAHYEWVELALSIAEGGEAEAGIDPEGDLMQERPVVSPLAWTLAYRWPVHRLSPAWQPGEPPAVPTFVVVYRHGDRVAFLQVDAPTARLLELLEAGEAATGRAALERVASEMQGGGGVVADSLAQGESMLRSLRERGVLLGTVRPEGPCR
jgi:hypothetical protein